MRALPVAFLLAAGSVAAADCPPLDRYQVAGLTLRGGALDAAVNQVLEGSAWRAEFAGPVQNVRLRMSGVSGDMDAVLKMIVETAARDSAVAGVSSTIDQGSCVVRVTAAAIPPKPAPVIAPPAPVVASPTPVAAAPVAAAPVAAVARPTPAATPAARLSTSSEVSAPLAEEGSHRAAPAAVPAAAPATAVVWAARRGSTLRQSLESWATKASCTAPDARIAGQTTWTLAWAPADVDYRIAAPLTFDGSISDAAQAVIRLYANADVRLGLRVHPNQCVLHVFAAARN